MSSFRKVIKAEVKRQGLSGYKIAQLTGIPMRSVQDYLSENHDMAGERLSEIARVLGLELHQKRRRTKKG